MVHLVVGAGASFAEARALGNEPEQCPPLMRDFARKTWHNYSPHPVLEAFLESIGHHEYGRDPRLLFYHLETEGMTSIERFLQFAWERRDEEWPVDPKNLPPGYVFGLRVTAGSQADRIEDLGLKSGFWENLQYCGIGLPFVGFMATCFHQNGMGWKELPLSQKMISIIQPSDLILNLNYDTVFELALVQTGTPFLYSPAKHDGNAVIVCKPHGSLNMVVSKDGFAFGKPDWLGTPEPKGFRSYYGLIPPRFGKSYAQSPITMRVLEGIGSRRPRKLILWGVGLADSDVDLNDIYAAWAHGVEEVDVINPDPGAFERAKSIFRGVVRQWNCVQDWVPSR